MTYYDKPFPSDDRFYESQYDPLERDCDSDERADEDDSFNDDCGDY